MAQLGTKTRRINEKDIRFLDTKRSILNPGELAKIVCPYFMILMIWIYIIIMYPKEFSVIF